MKLTCSFQIVDMGDELIAVPVGENAKQIKGVIKLNTEGAEILKLLNEGLQTDQIIEQLNEKYENNQAQLSNYVNTFVRKLSDMGLIET